MENLPRQPNDSKLLTTSEVAQRWGTSLQTVRNIAGSGFLSASLAPVRSDSGELIEQVNYRFRLENVLQAEQVLGIQPNGEVISGPWGVKARRLAAPLDAKSINGQFVDGQ